MSERGTPVRGIPQFGASGAGAAEPFALAQRESGPGSSADCTTTAGTAGDSLATSQPAIAARRNGLQIPGLRNRLLVAAATTGGLLAAVILPAQPAALAASAGSASVTSSPTAVAFSGTAAVGALFTVKRGKLVHFCTASVVHSRHGDLAITAAHCMQSRRLGSHSTVTFAPGYHDGKFPFGRWLVRSEFVDVNWKRHQDANDDFAFLVVGKAGQQVQKRTGGEGLETDVTLPRAAQVIGYPDATNRPVKCDGPAKRLQLKGYRQMVFDCGGFTNGTSGGPFLMHVSRKTGRGGIFGVIGGYQKGGDTASVSYSALFRRNVADLFKQASA
jgi:V8-like Glu-specific endopeptidase